MQGLQLELGSAASFWHLDFPTWQFLATDSWMTFTWQVVFESPLDLRGPPVDPLPPLQGDIAFMDFLQTLGLSNATMLRMNNLRLRAKIYWLSDATTVTGTQIHHDSWNGLPRNRPKVHDWPPTH